MARHRPATERVNLYLTTRAADLLKQLAPSPNKRGHYVSTLIERAAQEGGLLPEVDLAPVDLRALQRQVQVLQEQVALLQGGLRPE